MKLSVIIPVFNAQTYLPRCLDSLLNQGIRGDYEILCVDDGSTDHSLDILQRYAKKHSCIKVFVQENAGTGAARNTGLAHAEGEVITFCDADDYLIPNGLGYLLDTFWDDQIEVLCHASITLDPQKLKVWREDNEIRGSVICRGTGRSVYERDPKYFVWNTLIRRSFLQSIDLKFQPMTMAEDSYFMLELMMNAKNVIDVSSNIYRYTVNENQITRQRDPLMMRKCIGDYLSFLSRLRHYGLKHVYSCQRIPFMSRVLSAHLTKTEYTEFQARVRNIDLRVAPYWIYILMSYMHRKIFVPYVLPRLGRG